MKHSIILFFILLSLPGFSQTDTSIGSIADRIADYKLSKSELISKGRRMLLDEFRKDNMDTVAEIVYYFEKEINDNNHVGLWPAEQILLYYWIEEYDEIINFANYQLESTPTFHNRDIIYPPDNAIYHELIAASIDDFNYLKEGILEQEFSEDAENFLILMLKRILATEAPRFISMEQVNREADNFIENYPYSPLNEIVKEYISFKWEMGDWVLGFYIGGGYTLPSGNMLEYISSKGALCASFDLYYKRSAFMLSMQSGFGSVQQDIPVNNYGYWEKGESSNLTSVGLSLGYSVFDNTRFRITPLAGISFGFASPSETDLDSDLQNFIIGTSIAPIFNLNVTYRFINPNKLSPDNNIYYPAYGSFGINARVSYVPGILRQEGGQYAGDIWYLTIGLNMDMFSLKRK